MEYEQLEKIVEGIFVPNSKKRRMKVLKFGGKSLANGEGLNTVISIIENKVNAGEKITVVVSARSSATDDLEDILNKAVKGHPYKEVLQVFKNYQTEPFKEVDFSAEFSILDKLFEGVSLLGDYSKKTKDEILAQGELFSVKLIAAILNSKGIKANAVDSRELIKTDDAFGNAQPILQLFKRKC